MFYLTNLRGAERDKAILEKLESQKFGSIYLWTGDALAMRTQNRIYQLRKNMGFGVHVMLDANEPTVLAVVTYGDSLLTLGNDDDGKIV